jgi:hypothetical protein
LARALSELLNHFSHPLLPMTRQLEAVIFDWAGTIVDFGSFAPTQIFVDAFAQGYSFELSLEEVRRPMGLGKWQHIEALGQDPDVGPRWAAQFGRPMSPMPQAGIKSSLQRVMLRFASAARWKTAPPQGRCRRGPCHTTVTLDRQNSVIKISRFTSKPHSSNNHSLSLLFPQP